MRKILKPLPPGIAEDARQLSKGEGRNKSGVRYDAESRKAFYMQHSKDGVLSIWTFENIGSVETAAELWSALEETGDPTAAYTQVTGIPTESVGTRN